MPSSKFSGKLTIKLPAVCHKSLDGLKPDYYYAQPNQLSAFATWLQWYPPYDLAESFPLHQTVPGIQWLGSSGETGPNLQATVTFNPALTLYTFELQLRLDTRRLDDVDWDDVSIPPVPPFDSGLLVSHYPPPYPSCQLHVFD